MIKSKILLPILVACFSFFSCQNEKGKQLTITKIENKKTSNHIQIPGTHLFFINNDNFKLANNFTGLIKKEDELILVQEYPGTSYYEVLNEVGDFHQKNLADEIIEKKDIKVNGYSGKFYSKVTQGKYRSFHIHFGDSTFLVDVNGGCYANDYNTMEEIIQIMSSLVYEKDAMVDFSQKNRYLINQKESGFEYFSDDGNLFAYQKIIVNENQTDTLVALIGQYPTDEKIIGKDYVFNILGNSMRSGIQFSKSVHGEKVKINDYWSYQLETTATVDNQENIGVYICCMQKDNIAVLIIGTVPYENYKLIREFKKLTKYITIQ